jgi:flavin reductase (DIM6/NTAB) family NADH-FMN oxidoreductase RutF
MTTESSDTSHVEGDDFDDREFRRGVWRQTLTSVALLTVSAGGRDNVMACEWAMMVSRAPMCFTISVHPRNATHDLLIAAGEFGLSFCSDAQAHLSHVSGSNSLHDVDKWQLADFPTYPAKRIGAPMIDDAVLNVECRTVGIHRLGHTLFIGEAVWVRYDPAESPLIFHGGKYFQVGPQVPKGIAAPPGRRADLRRIRSHGHPRHEQPPSQKGRPRD